MQPCLSASQAFRVTVRSAQFRIGLSAVEDVLLRAGQIGLSEGVRAHRVREIEDAFYGKRGGTVRDPSRYDCMIGHTIEEVVFDAMQRRCDALMRGT